MVAHHTTEWLREAKMLDLMPVFTDSGSVCLHSAREAYDAPPLSLAERSQVIDGVPSRFAGCLAKAFATERQSIARGSIKRLSCDDEIMALISGCTLVQAADPLEAQPLRQQRPVPDASQVR